MSATAWVVVVVLVAVGLWAVAVYNRLVQLRNRIANAFGQIDVQLKQRTDRVQTDALHQLLQQCRVELVVAQLVELFQCLLVPHRRPVGLRFHHCAKGVDQAGHFCRRADLLQFQSARIAAAIKALVMMAGDIERHRPDAGRFQQYRVAIAGVLLDQVELGVSETPRLVEHEIGDLESADFSRNFLLPVSAGRMI